MDNYLTDRSIKKAETDVLDFRFYKYLIQIRIFFP